MNKQQVFIIGVLAVLCALQCGCAVLQLPLTLVGLTKNIVGGVLQLVDKLPKPPPWVFF